jgi:hypothetical protein
MKAQTVPQISPYLAFSPNGELLAVAEQPGSIVLWDPSVRFPSNCHI